jgi:predicted NBD/HSP70 family sugar kinase
MSHYTIGIDLGGTNIKGAIFNSQFELVSEKHTPTEIACGSDYVLNKIIQLIDSLINSLNLSVDLVEVVKEMRKHFEFPAYIDDWCCVLCKDSISSVK